MRILIDARPLIDPLNGGVTHLARKLLPAVLEAMPYAEFTLGTTGMRMANFGTVLPNNATHIHRTGPNKWFTFQSVTGLANFTHFFPTVPADMLLLFNLGFVGIPRIPYALLIHDLSFLITPDHLSLRGRLWHKAVRATHLIQHATHLFTVSKRTKQDVIDLLHVQEQKIHILPLGSTKTRSIANEPLPSHLDGTQFFLMLDADNPRKNSACILQAFEQLRTRHPNIKLVLTRSRAQAEDERHGIVRLANPTDEAISTLLSHATALLYPSWYEGFGLPLHEAALSGTPCIASTFGAVPETAPKGTLFASPAKPHHWTQTMELTLQMKEQTRTTTEEKSWTDAAKQIQAALTRPWN